MNPQHESAHFTNSSNESIEARWELFRAARDYPATMEEIERNPGLFIRGAVLARLLAIAAVYEEILNTPGLILDIGTWRGQTAVMCESLRAIHEPLNFQRSVIAFDTFDGYAGFSEADNDSAAHGPGKYAVGPEYAAFLSELLMLHEKNNAMGHVVGKHSVVRGDASITVADFLATRPGIPVALAFFDLNVYEPTRAALDALTRHLVSGSRLVFWQLMRPGFQAESRALSEFLAENPTSARLTISPIYPSMSIVEVV